MNDKIYLNSEISISAHQGTFIFDRPFILTHDKTLVMGMPYMLMEGNRTKAIRLLDIEIVQGIAYLKAEELESQKTLTLSWNLDYDGQYWLWSLADYETLAGLPYPTILMKRD